MIAVDNGSRLWLKLEYMRSVFLYRWPDYQSCTAHLNSKGWTIWAIGAAVTKSNHTVQMNTIQATLYHPDLFWNHTSNAQWRALCTDITEVNLSAFVCRLFHEDLHLSTDCFMKVSLQSISLQSYQLKRYRHETVCKQMQINQLL